MGFSKFKFRSTESFQYIREVLAGSEPESPVHFRTWTWNAGNKYLFWKITDDLNSNFIIQEIHVRKVILFSNDCPLVFYIVHDNQFVANFRRKVLSLSMLLNVIPVDHTKWVPVTTTWPVLRLPPIWSVAANILNKQSRTAEKGWSTSLEDERCADNSSPQKLVSFWNAYYCLGLGLILCYDPSNGKGHKFRCMECTRGSH